MVVSVCGARQGRQTLFYHGYEATHLPHEVVERHDRARDVQRRVQDVREVVHEAIHLTGMRDTRALPVIERRRPVNLFRSPHID